MPKSGRKAKSKYGSVEGHETERKLSLIDQLSEFQEFRETILPAIQVDVKSGLTAEQIREKYHAIVQAMIITTAVASTDPKARLAAGRDVLDRHEGTAKQRIEQTHKLEKLPESQIDSILISELEGVELGDAEDDTVQH